MLPARDRRATHGQKKTPVDVSDLAAETYTGVDEIENLGDRIARYGAAHSRTVEMRDHLRGSKTETP